MTILLLPFFFVLCNRLNAQDGTDWNKVVSSTQGFESVFYEVPEADIKVNEIENVYSWVNHVTDPRHPNRFYSITVWAPADTIDLNYAFLKKEKLIGEYQFSGKYEYLNKTQIGLDGNYFSLYFWQDKKDGSIIYMCIGVAFDKVYRLEVHTRPESQLNEEAMKFIYSFQFSKSAFDVVEEIEMEHAHFSVDFPYSFQIVRGRNISGDIKYKIWADCESPKTELTEEVINPATKRSAKVKSWTHSGPIKSCRIIEMGYSDHFVAGIMSMGVQLYLEKILRMTLNDCNITLLKKENISYNGMDGIEMIMNTPSGIDIHRIFYHNKTFYELQVILNTGVLYNKCPEAFQFLNSFRINQ